VIKLNALLRLFLQPGQTPFLYLLFSMGLAVATNALYEQFKIMFSAPMSVLIITISVLLILVGVTILARWFFLPKVVIGKIAPKRALIVLVSQGELKNIPASEAIKFHYSPRKGNHTLEYCWLLRTPAPEEEPPKPARSSWFNAQSIEKKYRGKVKMFQKSIEFDDPETSSIAVEQAVREARKFGIKPSDMVADVTGGTKMMSMGMALASIAAGIEMTYLKAKKTLPDGRVDPSGGSDPMRVDIEYYRRENMQNE